MSNSIILKNYLGVREELTATAVAVIPGTLLEVTSAGTVQAHSSAGGNILPIIAVENELEGDGITTVIAASNKVQAWIPQRGDQAQLILADGETVVIGTLLESNGAGYVRAYTPDSTGIYYPQNIVGQALEALDLSGSISSLAVLGENRHLKVRLF